MNGANISAYKDWTLFLDRDGVLNVKLENDYVKHLGEFVWLPDVPQTLAKLSTIFKHIIIVTNQQGIGKGLMTHEDLALIHRKLSDDVKKCGGHIHAIFYAPQLASEHHPDRKPGIGMLLKAKQLFPDIQFDKSIVVGDSITDMLMADNAGARKVYIASSGGPVPCDFVCKSLPDFLHCLLEGKLKIL